MAQYFDGDKTVDVACGNTLKDLKIVKKYTGWKWERTYSKFEFKIEDFWVGVFWKTSLKKNESGEYMYSDYDWWYQRDVWIILIPCFPLHLVYKMGDYKISERLKNGSR
jgi:hypothetical protein